MLNTGMNTPARNRMVRKINKLIRLWEARAANCDSLKKHYKADRVTTRAYETCAECYRNAARELGLEFDKL